ncbi:MAG: DUF1289 domain-containing protein [Reinekea sp.]|nr:DUF1289 domain-containing protein [Reinekea sp.]MDX1473051.1 DUF1289 domain-containing protein [Reinekea sp.]
MSEPRHYIESPCIRHCTLNDQDTCVGCGRSLEEIKRWSTVSCDEQVDILARAKERLIQMRTHPDV